MMEDAVVRQTVDKQMALLMELNEEVDKEVDDRKFEKDYDFVDYYLPSQGEEEDDESELPPKKKSRVDDSDVMLVEERLNIDNLDKDLARGLNHEYKR